MAAYKNRIRIPMQLHSAQFPEERTVFRKANGVTKTLSVVVRKTYEVETDFIPELWHQRLKISLAHDNVSWEGDHYLGGVAQDGDYNIQWPEGVLHYPTAKAECKVQVTPFDATNSNCQTCEEATQLELEDDTVTSELYGGVLEEDSDYMADLAENDLICCYPAVFSLVSYNSDYLTSATINAATGVLSIHTGTDLMSANGLLIATYRVTCPNGGYDEANVYASIEGTNEDSCAGPSNVRATIINTEDITFAWDSPGVGLFTYYWELYEGTDPIGSPVQTGTLTMTAATSLFLSGLTSGTEYYFQIRRTCPDSDSIFSGVATETIPETETCGEYEVAYNDGTGDPSHSLVVQYRDCNLNLQLITVFNNSSVIICAGQTSPGVPVAISGGTAGGSTMTVTYLGLC